MQEKKPLGLIASFLLLSLAGQYLFKMGMSGSDGHLIVSLLAGDISGLAAAPLACSWGLCWHSLQMLFQPWVFLGMACYALSTVCWLAILSKVDLSFAYPMISLGYIGILLIGWLGFGEEVTAIRWMGVVLISIGILGIYSERSFVSWGTGLAGLLSLMGVFLLLSQHAAQVADNFEKPLLLILLTIPLGIVGQILFKAGMNQPVSKERVKTIGSDLQAAKSGEIKALLDGAWESAKLFFSLRVFSGLFVYVISTVIWLVLLSKVPLTFLYPLLSVGYVIILLIGWLVFHEHVTVIRWYGVILICFGIITIYSEVLVYSYVYLFTGLLLAMAIFLAAISLRSRRKKEPEVSGN